MRQNVLEAFASYRSPNTTTAGASRMLVQDLASDPSLPKLLDIIILTERFGFTKLADLAMKQLLDHMKGVVWFPQKSIVGLITTKTAVGSKLRLYTLRSLIHAALDNNNNQELARETLEEFMADKESRQEFLDILSRMPTRRLRGLDNGGCDYHQHGSDEECPYADAEDDSE